MMNHIGDIFPRKQYMTFHANCLHPLETICMKCYDISCKLPPSIGDNLYEMSKPLFSDKLEKIFNMSSAENFYPEC